MRIVFYTTHSLEYTQPAHVSFLHACPHRIRGLALHRSTASKSLYLGSVSTDGQLNVWSTANRDRNPNKLPIGKVIASALNSGKRLTALSSTCPPKIEYKQVVAAPKQEEKGGVDSNTMKKNNKKNKNRKRKQNNPHQNDRNGHGSASGKADTGVKRKLADAASKPKPTKKVKGSGQVGRGKYEGTITF